MYELVELNVFFWKIIHSPKTLLYHSLVMSYWIYVLFPPLTFFVPLSASEI